MFKGLSLDQAPPFEAPLLFFLAGLFFALVGSVSLFFFKAIPNPLAIFHLFSVGFFLNVMFGALEQMLPVVVGAKFKKPLPLTLFSLAFILVGLVTLFFTFPSNPLYGAVILSIGVLGFALAVVIKIFTFSSPTQIAILLSTLSLIIAVIIVLISLFFSLPLAPLHALFALWGWVGLLIVGVSFQVIPMFYVTFEIERKYQYLLVFGIFGSVVFKAFFPYLPPFFALFYLLFALLTLIQLFKRKRTLLEPSILFWYFGLLFLAVSSFLFLFAQGLDLVGVVLLFLFGFAMNIIFAMLYKIIPFLVWFHISSRGFFDIPTMKEMIDPNLAYFQLAVTLTAFLMALLYLPLVAPLLLLSFLLLLFNLLKPIRLYFEYKNKPNPFS